MQPGSAPLTNTAASALPHAVRDYKRYYYLLLIVSGLLLLSIFTYIWLWKRESGHVHHALNGNSRLRGVMAVDDSSGQFIAAIARNEVDSVVSVLVSEDGGTNFEEWGTWKIAAGEKRDIHKIFIAPDHRSIVAMDDHNIYIKGANADSFVVLKATTDLETMRGAVFSAISDSVFAFSNDSIYAFDYKKYDSVSVGYLNGLASISSLTIAAETNHLAGIAVSRSAAYAQGAFANYRVTYRRTSAFGSFQNGVTNEPASTAPPPDTSLPSPATSTPKM